MNKASLRVMSKQGFGVNGLTVEFEVLPHKGDVLVIRSNTGMLASYKILSIIHCTMTEGTNCKVTSYIWEIEQ